MDAAALLKSQGWRGKGFSLHASDNSIGLAKPLLLSRNIDGRGVGQKPHYTSDQWWLHAFDQKLKGLDTSKKGTVVQSVTQGKLDVIAGCGGNRKYSGLYASFVRGETIDGTITLATTEDATDATPVSDDQESVPRVRELETASKEERRARRAAKRLRREEMAAREVIKAEAERKVAKRAAKKDKKEAKRKAKQTLRSGETREQRRARRSERRARKEVERRKREGTSNTRQVDEV